jgi:EpsI family protein
MRQFTTWPRFLIAIGTLLLPNAALHFRSYREAIAPHTDVALFPHEINGWKGSDITLSPEELAVLGPGQFLLRDYDRANTPTVTLFLAYYPSQKTGDTMHSPKNCLPGAGWTQTRSEVVTFPQGSGSALRATRYLVAQGADKMVVLYWFQAHGRTVANEYWAKWFLVRDAIVQNRTDGALVRVSTSIESGETEDDADGRTTGFAQMITSQLDSYIPR